MPDPGGISICSGGQRAHRGRRGRGACLPEGDLGGNHTRRTCWPLWAQGMTEVPAYFEGLAKVSGAKVARREAPGNYPFPGIDTFAYYYIDSVPEFDPAARYPHVNSYLPIHRAAGVRLFKGHGGQHRATRHHRMARIAGRAPPHRSGRVHPGTRRHDPLRRPPRQGSAGRRARVRRVRGQRGDAAPVVAGEAGADRRVPGKHRRRHPHGPGGRRRSLAHVALPRHLRLPPSRTRTTPTASA